jgi:two-component system, sensor histidine kinase PdtaS
MGIFTPRFIQNLNDFDKTRYAIVWRLLLLFNVIFGVLTFSFSHSSRIAFYIYLAVFVLSIITTVFVKLTNAFIIPYYVFAISASIIITISFVYLDNTLHYPDFFWIIAIILFAYIGLGKRWAFFFIIYHACTISYYFIFALNRNLLNFEPITKTQLFGILTEIFLSLFIIFYLFYIYVRFKEYFEIELTLKNENLKDKNRMIEQKNTENTTLVKEVHHRVKNNLQIVISLLRMQSNDIENEESKLQFNEAIGRIMTISIIHQKLYEQKNLAEVNFENYFIQLIDEIKRLHDSQVLISIDIDPHLRSVGLNSIVPLGLILNELITNSIKHNSRIKDQTNINISFKEGKESSILFVYSDSGEWKEPDSDKSNGKFGLELISVLTEQMEGTYKREGTTYLFNVKNLDI